MSRFIEGERRTQAVLFSGQLEDWITDNNPVRAVDAFVDELDLTELGFAGAQPGLPAFRPATLLKIYIYGYLNRIQSSRRLEREAQRNVDFIHIAKRDEYRCPAGERAVWRMTRVENGRKMHRYSPSACPRCAIKLRCTPAIIAA